MALFKEDKRAAYMGLIGGAIALLILVYGMVQITNRKFEGHGEPGAPAAQTGH